MSRKQCCAVCCVVVGALLGAPALAWAQTQPGGAPLFRGAVAVQGAVGAAGATFELSSGAHLEVSGPAGAGQTVVLAEAPSDPRVVDAPWPWTADFRRIGSALRVNATLRGSAVPVVVTVPCGPRPPTLRPGERLVVVVEHVGEHEAHGGTALAGPTVQLPAGPDPRAAIGVPLSVIRLPSRPGAGGDPRAGAIIEPDILRIPAPGSAGGDGRAGASIDPLIVRIPRSGGGTRINYWAIGTARLDAAGRTLTASIPFDGELRAVTFGVTTWNPAASLAGN